MSDPERLAAAEPRLRRGRFARLWWLVRLAEVRLRFIVVLAVLFLVIGGWGGLKARFDGLLRRFTGVASVEGIVSSDTEYFCPMDPGVLSDWPEKCPICQMALVRRKKGDAVLLPAGITSRMQLSPDRIQLAGVRTVAAEYRLLKRELTVGGVLTLTEGQHESDPVWYFTANIARTDIPLLESAPVGEVAVEVDGMVDADAAKATMSLVEIDGSSPPRVRVEVRDPARQFRAGQYAAATLRINAAAFEPFQSLAAPPPALREKEPRSAYYCPNHADALHDSPGACPLDTQPLVERPLADNERLRWWCPMHPRVTADEPGRACAECNGMRLVPRLIAFAPAGTVLAIPESAVVDLGRERIAYVERMPGMYDGVLVELGPRCGGQYPVLSGLAAGDRVVAAGAFLLDAETRLNPALASSYFGAGPNIASQTNTTIAPSATPNDKLPARIAEALSTLGKEDRAAAERQGKCPVTGLALGSMGAPIKVSWGDGDVFVCCQACIAKLDAKGAKTPDQR